MNYRRLTRLEAAPRCRSRGLPSDTSDTSEFWRAIRRQQAALDRDDLKSAVAIVVDTESVLRCGRMAEKRRAAAALQRTVEGLERLAGVDLDAVE